MEQRICGIAHEHQQKHGGLGQYQLALHRRDNTAEGRHQGHVHYLGSADKLGERLFDLEKVGQRLGI